jgi:hypothetical protein
MKKDKERRNGVAMYAEKHMGTVDPALNPGDELYIQG